MAQVELILKTDETFGENNKVTDAKITKLLGGYAVAVLPEKQVERFLEVSRTI